MLKIGCWKLEKYSMMYYGQDVHVYKLEFEVMVNNLHHVYWVEPYTVIDLCDPYFCFYAIWKSEI